MLNWAICKPGSFWKTNLEKVFVFLKIFNIFSYWHFPVLRLNLFSDFAFPMMRRKWSPFLLPFSSSCLLTFSRAISSVCFMAQLTTKSSFQEGCHHHQRKQQQQPGNRSGPAGFLQVWVVLYVGPPQILAFVRSISPWFDKTHP